MLSTTDQPSEHLAQMLAKATVPQFAPTFGDQNNVVVALPLRVA